MSLRLVCYLRINKMKYSDCCGAELYNHDELDLCPECLEHCGVDEDLDEYEMACDKADQDYNAKIEDSL